MSPLRPMYHLLTTLSTIRLALPTRYEEPAIRAVVTLLGI